MLQHLLTPSGVATTVVKPNVDMTRHVATKAFSNFDITSQSLLFVKFVNSVKYCQVHLQLCYEVNQADKRHSFSRDSL